VNDGTPRWISLWSSGAFAHLGATPKNPRWSWSARGAGPVVVLALWKDKLNYSDGRAVYHDLLDPPERQGAGAQNRTDNMAYAMEHCGGVFGVVICVAEDVNERPRSIAECWPQDRLQMRVTEFDPQTGEFCAEQV